MTRIRITATINAAFDGINVLEYEAGAEADAPQHIAESLVGRDVAEYIDEAPAPAKAPDEKPVPDLQVVPAACEACPDPEACKAAGACQGDAAASAAPEAGAGAPEGGAAPEEAAAEVVLVDESLSRAALNDIADKNGIEGAAKLPNKAAVVAAIEAKLAEG